jgi:hypothetical protein
MTTMRNAMNMNKVMNDISNERRSEPGTRLTEQQLRARRSRSIAIALALGAFVVMIFLVTLVRLGPAVLTKPF